MKNLTSRQSSILRTALMREINERPPLPKPVTASGLRPFDTLPFDTLVEHGLGLWGGGGTYFILTQKGRDTALSLVR